MESYDDWEYEDYEENTNENKPYYTYLKYTNNQNSKNSPNIISSSKYSQRLTINLRQKLNNDNKNLKTNYSTNNNYNTYQNIPPINNIHSNQNSNQYFSQNNKYLITFSSNQRKIDLKGKRSSDGVLRGYTNNCSFYVSGSSNLNKTSNYENKAMEKTIPYSHKNSKKNNYIKINNIYDRTNENNKLKNKDNINNNSKICTSSTDKNFSKYQIPVNLNNAKEQTPKINYTQTEPSNNVIYFSQNTSSTTSFKYNSNYNKENNKFNNKNNYNNSSSNNLYNNNHKRVYKTSTNTNFNDIIRKNYFLTESEPKPKETKRRNNTPSGLRLVDNYISSKDEYRNNYYKININQDEKNKGRHHISEIPHNFMKERNNCNLDKNPLNNTTRNPQTIYSFNKPNSNSNSNLNTDYIRYNKFQIKPRKREYGTRTETYSYDNKNYSSALLSKNEKEVDIHELPRYKEKINYIRKISPKRYGTHSINYSLPKNNRRNYGVHTETSSMNRNRNNEYEVTDINKYKKNQKEKNTNYNYAKKEYSTYERGLKNIIDNKKEIEKDEKIREKRRESNHHKVYISNNFSQNKKYKTNTQTDYVTRRNKYNLDNLNEYEVDIDTKNKYDKYKRNKNQDKNIQKIDVNNYKNNYLKEKENLEEELEMEDDNEQNEYIPPKQIFEKKNKNNETHKINENINNNINKYQRTPPATTQNYLKNYYEPSISSKPNQQENNKKELNINKNKKYIPQTVSLQPQYQNQEIKYIPIQNNNIINNDNNKKIEEYQEEEIENNEEQQLETLQPKEKTDNPQSPIPNPKSPIF